MRRNLLIGCVGPTSIHENWLSKDRNYDVMIVHYGEGDSYKGQGEYYIRAKGTKFNIIGNVFDQIPSEYEYFFIPDDDLYLKSEDVNRLFDIAKEYSLQICQPSLIGYYSININLHHPGNVLRYTNFVEIIAPCFSRNAFEKCRDSFTYNKSCWAIDVLWDKILGHPQDAIAVIDDVIAVHTRPCFWGDNYSNNNVDNPYGEAKKLMEENNLSWDKKTYSCVEKKINYDDPSEKRLYPNVEFMKSACTQLGRKFFI